MAKCTIESHMHRGRLRAKSNSLALRAANQCISFGMCARNTSKNKHNMSRQANSYATASHQIPFECINVRLVVRYCIQLHFHYIIRNTDAAVTSFSSFLFSRFIYFKLDTWISVYNLTFSLSFNFRVNKQILVHSMFARAFPTSVDSLCTLHGQNVKTANEFNASSVVHHCAYGRFWHLLM